MDLETAVVDQLVNVWQAKRRWQQNPTTDLEGVYTRYLCLFHRICDLCNCQRDSPVQSQQLPQQDSLVFPEGVACFSSPCTSSCHHTANNEPIVHNAICGTRVPRSEPAMFLGSSDFPAPILSPSLQQCECPKTAPYDNVATIQKLEKGNARLNSALLQN